MPKAISHAMTGNNFCSVKISIINPKKGMINNASHIRVLRNAECVVWFWEAHTLKTPFCQIPATSTSSPS